MIALASDHIGLELKRHIIEYLNTKKLSYKDYGAFSAERCDYPLQAQRAARAVASGECERGILFCGTGAGVSIAANKVRGIRCVVCSEPYSARLSRLHNNTNMLALGTRVVGPELALMIAESWLEAEYEGGRHHRRVEQIASIESGGVDALLAQLTLEEKIQLVHGQKCDPYRGNQAGFVAGIKRLGIPDVFVCDGELGVNVSWDATMFPSKVGLAATFDTDTARQYGEALGREAKSAGMNVILTPRVNIVRDPVADIEGSNGGNYQTYGEDPVLNGRMGAAEAQGIQRDNNCIATVKQMLGSSTGTAQGSPRCIIGEQAMREIYMRVFEEPIRSGAGSAMTNYNQVNGQWTYMFSEMNQKLCRDEWGFAGFLVDDWHCLFDTESIMENVTLEMPGRDYYGEGNEKSVYGAMLKQAVLDPASPVTETHLDKAVRDYLDTLKRFGMLDAQRVPGPIAEDVKQKSIRDAKEIAVKTAVLLKNEDDILPLDTKADTLALIGPTARQTATPVFKEASYGFPDRKRGPLAALRGQMQNEVAFAVGNDLEGTVIPADNLRLTRRIVRLPDSGNHEFLELSGTDGALVDTAVNFAGDTALPPLKPDFEDTTVVPYYLWQGQITTTETGYYRLSVQTYTPGVEEFARHVKHPREMEILTSGNLYFKEKDAYRRLSDGYRVLMNGGASPNSSVVPCLDGWNNVGGYVHMEADQAYDLVFTAGSVYNMPVGVRLCWVTPSMEQKNIDEAVKAAQNADKAIVIAWQKSPSGVLELAECQNRLIEAVAEANPNTVVVLNSGDPVAMPWRDKVKGILEMWYPGQEGGYATADVLTGHANPSGKLPVTFPKKLTDTAPHAPGHPERCGKQKRLWTENTPPEYVSAFTEGVNMGYRWFDANQIEPLYAFGFGLSYTSFAYEDLTVKRAEGGVSVSFTLTNTGKRFGAEAAQVYLGRPDGLPEGVQASPKTLAAFKRVELEPGESRTVALLVDEKHFAYYSEVEKAWIRPEGTRSLYVGASSRDLRLEAVV